MSRNEILEVYAASISGGGFPAQLQEILYYTEQKRKAFSSETTNISDWFMPDLCMGTSGGNVALYIAISGNFTEGGIKRVVQKLNPEMFSQTWWPEPMSFIPTWILGIFEGAVYRPGYGAKNLLNAFNNFDNIQDIEMWNSAYSKTSKKTGLFCNKDSSDTFISPYTYSPFDFKTLPLNYLSGDINKISKTVIASASIPFLFKPVNIDNQDYIDGGVTYNSPLTTFQEEIYKCIKGIVEPYPYEVNLSNPAIPIPTQEQKDQLITKRTRNILHLTYFSSYNMDSTENPKSALGSGSIFEAISDASAIKDRYTGINLLERVKLSNQKVYSITSQENSNLSELLSTYSPNHYFLQIYVRENEWIDMTNFTPKDIIDKMNEAKNQIEYIFFYVSN
jgi:predicted acylesterase/phospholipase RssA